ncbi:MAG: hypothetical protein CBC12_02905 [Candidatus Puniceispirillum sp. TMED52]|nr:hypothetical protein [SAR116 cluster bacterium]OUU53205.1 MAG: hypothetical protein CBC12_02905 [Candidatus Puniceispirillum sp. TMED52]HCP17909.1 hypothetical protein [Alphaproteobacteria bacterium]
MFMTASHWSIDQVTDSMVAEAEAKFMPMIMDTGATHAYMVQTGDDSMMVVVQFPDAETGQAALPKIGSIREMAAEQFGMTLQNAVAGVVRAQR